MENENNEITIADFLQHTDTEQLFAELDYKLRDGFHYHHIGSQIPYFKYIESNIESLQLFYKTILKVSLVEGGDDFNTYYHLDFNNSDRGNVPSNNRHFIKNEHIIIGFVIYEIININKEIDLNSIQQLKEKIRIDYEDIKPGIYRLIAKSKNTNPSNLNDSAIDNAIDSALREFKKIGWMVTKNDEFDCLPAFRRLVDIYENEIANIDEIYNELK